MTIITRASPASIGDQRSITITIFQDQNARKKTEVPGPWQQLHDLILQRTAPRKDALQWIKLARFGNIPTPKGSLRHDANMLAITGIEGDYDKGVMSVNEAVAKLTEAGIEAMVYTTPSHTPENPRWRVLCPTSKELPPDQREGLMARLNGVLGGVLAGESFTRSQAYYFGSVNNNPAHRVEMIAGTPIDLLTALDVGARGRASGEAEPNVKLSPNSRGLATTKAARLSNLHDVGSGKSYQDVITSGESYHEPMVRWAGVMAKQGVSAEDAVAALEAAFDSVPPEQRDERWETRRRDIGRCVEGIYAKDAAAKAEKVSIFGSRPLLFSDYDHDDKMLVVREALVEANAETPRLFRGVDGRIVQLERGASGRLLIQPVGKDELRLEIDKVVRCLEGKVSKQVTVWEPVVAQTLIDKRLELPFLEGVVSAPVFGADGTIRTQAGYSSASGVFYDPRGLEVPDVLNCPSREDVERAKGLLNEVLCDFPFDGPNGAESERAHMLGLLLLPFARQMITGPTPIHLIVKPTPGTGASKLVNVWSLIAHGCEATAQTETRQEDEFRKRITSVLVEGSAAFYLDNINHKVDSSALASAVTAPVWTDRVLGTNKTVSVPVRLAWIFAGNNPTMSNEIARRCVRIRLDAKVERPELRTGFRHPNLEGWVRERRGDLVWACLTLLQNWIAGGRGAPDRVMGSFEDWSHVIGGTLKAARVAGFLANDAEMREDADEEGGAIRAFLSAWWGKYGEGHVLAGRDLYDDLYGQGEDIALPLNGLTQEARKGALGRFVGRLKGRVFTVQDDDGTAVSVKVVPGPSRGGATKWKLEPLRN